jgi:HEPN domain-containing protein
LTPIRLVLVDVTWAHWGVTPSASEERWSWFRHRNFLASLLGSRLNHFDTIERDGPIAEPGAWISLKPRMQALEDKIESLREGAGFNDLLWPWKWFEDEMAKPELTPFSDTKTFFKTDKADTVVDFIAEGLRQCELSANRAELRGEPGLLADQMNLFACRLYLTPQRAAGLIHGPPANSLAVPGHTVIDLRFREHLGRYWLYATFSIWTHRPPSIDLQDSVENVDDAVDEPLSEDFLKALRARYSTALRRGFQDHVHAFFPAAQMTILDREYQPPRFWMVEGQDHTAATNGHVVGERELLNELLSVAQPGMTGLAAGDIDARADPCRARMFRRFIPNPRGTHDRPVHLILPQSPATITLEHLWSVVEPLSDLEGDAATQLFEIITDIDMYRSQLNLYEKVAAQGSALWDQAALFLPVAEGYRLRRVHRSIELMHQVLLQGIADLEEEAANAQHAIERIEVVAYDLKNRFDRNFTEVPVSERVAIRNSLVEAGYFDKARRAARGVHEQSRQVRATYQALLKGITYAFDERRVRETDVLQSVALGFALALGLVSSWNEFLARYISLENWQGIGGWVGYGLAGIVGVLVAIWLRRRQFSRLTGHRFRRHFKGKLQKLLTAYSSDRLDRLRAEDRRHALHVLAVDEIESKASNQIATIEHDRVLRKDAESWRRLDQMLARETAQVLDNLLESPSRERTWTEKLPKSKIRKLHKRVEIWALRALLLTERPRRFCHSALPRLTFLYRFFPITSGKPALESDWSEADSQVSDSDFTFTVVNQCGGDPEHIPALNHWGHRQVRECENAVAFVAKLEEVGLAGRMTSEEFYAMMGKMNELGGSPEARADFQRLRSEADARLQEATILSDNSHYKAACKSSWTCAKEGLTGLLRRTESDVSADYDDLLRLGVQARRRTGGPLPAEFQEAIWRLSAYRGVFSEERVAPRDYGESEAKTALSDARIVLNQVDKWITPTAGAQESGPSLDR